jgi:uncharacterized repeat protein (TIGR01451 family)
MRPFNFSVQLLVFMAFAALFTSQISAGDEGINLEMVVKEEITTINEQGEQIVSLVEPKSVVPGDIVVYTTYYRNKSDSIAKNVAITNPIPLDTTYFDDSAKGKDSAIEYSADGGKEFAIKEQLAVTDIDGKTYPASARDYTHIRWTIKELVPGSNGNVSFRTKVK